jgi:phage gpG-like protein
MTGKLGKSLTYILDSMSVTVGSNLVYAAIQQLGGEVKPKGHPYLAIRSAAICAAGSIRDRRRARCGSRSAIRMGTHSWTGPALVRSGDVSVTGKDGKQRVVRRKGEVMFALIKRATIRGRPYLVFNEAARKFLIGELTRDYQRAWRGP